MDTVPGLSELQRRKRDLLIESDLNRQVLRLELDQLCIRAGEIQRGFGWARNVWAWGAPLAGFLFARKFKKAGGAFAKGSFFITAAQAGWKFWQAYRERRSGGASER